MSLLNDLKKEVTRIKTQEVQKNAELESQGQIYNTQLRPVMESAYRYFSEIVENLNIVEPDINPSYPLDPLSENGVALKQSHYKFRFDNRDSPHQLDIHCQCTLEKPYEFYLSSQKPAEAHAELLNSFDFPYHRKNRLNSHHDICGATFILEGPMPIHIRISASPADRSIHIALRNIGGQSVNRYKFLPESVDDQFLERLAKLLIREVPQLTEVKVYGNFREKLRQQIEVEKRHKEDGLAQAYASEEASMQPGKRASLINRIGQAFSEKSRWLIRLLSKTK